MARKTLKGLKGGKNNITKADLVDFVSVKSGMTKKDVGIVLNAAFDQIKDITKSGGYLTIAGFGTFKEGMRKARIMTLSAKQRKTFNTDAKTKKVPASKYLKFSSSKTY